MHTFHRLINNILSGLSNCSAYLDDLVVYTETWQDHLQILCQVFHRLAQAALTLNLATFFFFNMDEHNANFEQF